VKLQFAIAWIVFPSAKHSCLFWSYLISCAILWIRTSW